MMNGELPMLNKDRVLIIGIYPVNCDCWFDGHRLAFVQSGSTECIPVTDVRINARRFFQKSTECRVTLLKVSRSTKRRSSIPQPFSETQWRSSIGHFFENTLMHGTCQQKGGTEMNTGTLSDPWRASRSGIRALDYYLA